MLTPTFSSINANILQATDSSGRSQCVACHNGRSDAIPLNLATDPYSHLVGKGTREKPGLKYVEPGDSASSYLYLKLVGGAGISGKRMPFNGPPYLTDGQIQVIKRWIDLGAQNN